MATPPRHRRAAWACALGLLVGPGCAGPPTLASVVPGVHLWLRVQVPHSLSAERLRLGRGWLVGASAGWQLQQGPRQQGEAAHLSDAMRRGDTP